MENPLIFSKIKDAPYVFTKPYTCQQIFDDWANVSV